MSRYNYKKDITPIEDLPELTEIQDIPEHDQKYNKYIRQTNKIPPQAEMTLYKPHPHEHQYPPQQIIEIQEPSKDNDDIIHSCLEVSKHIKYCPICSHYYNNNKLIYGMGGIIVALLIIIFFLVKNKIVFNI